MSANLTDALVADLPWLQVTVESAVATVTLNRPERLNALTPEMRADLWRVLIDLDHSAAVRAFVLTGTGNGFCAGSDRERLSRYTADGVERRIRDQQYGTDSLLRLEKPLVAAVNGAVAGLGFAIAVMADVRFSVASAKWTTSFARLGLCAEAGLSRLLPRLVGSGWANDLLLTARVLDGAEAQRIGLVQYLVEPDMLVPEAQKYAARLAANSPWSVATMRRQLREDMSHDLRDVMSRAETLVIESIAGDDFAEAQRAIAERRDPKFA